MVAVFEIADYYAEDFGEFGMLVKKFMDIDLVKIDSKEKNTNFKRYLIIEQS